MKQKEEIMPLDRRIIQDSLVHIAQGPEAFMKWVSDNYKQFDQKFLNQLRKMTEYSQKNGQEKEHKLFQFLENCFYKTLGKQGFSELSAITKENFIFHLQQANNLLKKELFAQAIPLYQALLAFLDLEKNNMHRAIIDANLGICYSQSGNTAQAIEHLKKAINSPDLPEEAKEKVCSNLGNIFRNSSQFNEALEYHQQAVQYAQSRQDQRMECIHLSNLALVYLDLKELEKAIQIQKQAHDIAMKMGALDLLKDSMTRMAMLHGINNDMELCQKYCQQGLMLLQTPDLGNE